MRVAQSLTVLGPAASIDRPAQFDPAHLTSEIRDT
jgi:hypothetical protein